MTRAEQTNWNKNLRLGTRGVGAAAGFAIGGTKGAALGYKVGSMADPIINELFQTFDTQHKIKQNISRGTMADSYTYGKTQDAYSLTDYTPENTMERFDKGLDIADTAVDIYSSISGFAGKGGGTGTGGFMGAEGAMKGEVDMATLMRGTEGATGATGGKGFNIGDWYRPMLEKYKAGQEDRRERRAVRGTRWDRMVDRELEDEIEHYEYSDEDYVMPQASNRNVFKSIQDYFNRKKNLPSF